MKRFINKCNGGIINTCLIQERGININEAYRCPNCKTNRTRFNIIEQKATGVKMDPNTGETVDSSMSDPFHMPYTGPKQRIQCGVCGLIESEHTFVTYATYENTQKGE